MQIIKLLKPALSVIENVPVAWHTEDSMWVRYQDL
jgi:hypothetical protein